MKSRITQSKGTHFKGDKVTKFKGQAISYPKLKYEAKTLAKKHGIEKVKKTLKIQHIHPRQNKPMGMRLSELGKAAEKLYINEDKRKIKYKNPKKYLGRKMLQRELAKTLHEK